MSTFYIQLINKIRMPHKRIAYLIAQIDLLVSGQVNEILHHHVFQALEANWRAVVELSREASDKIKIRLLDATFDVLEQDISSKLEFDQTHVFDKVYSAEFGMPGGEPYSLLIGNYYVDIKNPSHMLTLTGLSQIAAAAFAPLITSIQFDNLNIQSYEALVTRTDEKNTSFMENESSWQRFRQTDDACFVGFILPKILMRQVYLRRPPLNAWFQFHETVNGAEQCLWGHPGYLFALNVIHCFKQTAWFDDLSKRPLNFLPDWKQMEYFMDHTTEIVLNQLGIMIWVQRGYGHPVYCHNSFSVQITKMYETENATINARIAGILKYLFCVSRFAHYVKVIAREKIGTFQNSADFQYYLNQWIGQYVAANEVPDKMRPIYPLKNAQISVINKPGQHATKYQCIIRLMPRLDLESANFSLQLITLIGDQ